MAKVNIPSILSGLSKASKVKAIMLQIDNKVLK